MKNTLNSDPIKKHPAQVKCSSYPSTFWHPRYWLLWLGLGVLWLCVKLPYRLQIGLGRLVGRIALPFSHHRRKVTYANLRACFPALTENEINILLKRSFESAGIALFEFGMAWWMPIPRFNKFIQWEGQEYLKNALSEGRGAILLAGHFTTIEIAGRALTQLAHYHVIYREHKNPLIDWIMCKSRERGVKKAVKRNDVTQFIKGFRKNTPILYAPDQDYGRKHSVFVPFFGVQAATITATARIAKIGKAPVLPYFIYRREDGKGYLAKIYPPLINFPTGDEYRDAQFINQIIEQAVLKSPEQYLWQHRRFKTRPLGEPSFYE
jgi:Kdo2-lipid IVA lauroyltransferase/acyltransferase